MRKLFYVIMFLSLQTVSLMAQNIKLIIRADDMGSFHAANNACIDGHQKGIVTSIEVMTCCSWFPEAVSYLTNRDSIMDVGVHLMLTSEWLNIKWKPLTRSNSLTDENGYFFPFMTPRNDLETAYPALSEKKWKMDEVEKEYRAQIEMAKKNLPRLSHVSTHMGVLNHEVADLVQRLAKEYGLYVNQDSIKHFRVNLKREQTSSERIDAFIQAIQAMTPGTYMFLEHPAYNTNEMETVGHIGYMEVGIDRQKVIEMFMSDKIKDALVKKGVRLISYADLKK
jgi:predicted glycoside hydrolase/deacetylase ChbG (UPF0249 family)